MYFKNLQKLFFLACLLFASCAFLSDVRVAHSQEFTSSSFKVLDPVVKPAEYSTSNNFTLLGTLSQVAIGTSTASTFNLFGGFLYFPFVSTPAVTATAGDAQVALS